MSLIEKWLRLEGYKSIYTESAPAALRFYRSIHYVEMPFNDADGYQSDPSDTPMGKTAIIETCNTFKENHHDRKILL